MIIIGMFFSAKNILDYSQFDSRSIEQYSRTMMNTYFKLIGCQLAAVKFQSWEKWIISLFLFIYLFTGSKNSYYKNK